MVAFWVLIIAALLTPIFGRSVLYVTVITVLGLVPWYAAETPVEEESYDEST